MGRGRFGNQDEGTNGAERSSPVGRDAAERMRIAAESAAREAERRVIDEILGLEQDLDRAKDEATHALGVIENRLADAERRATEAQKAQADAERRARDEVASQVEIETANLRDQLDTLRAEVEERVREAADEPPECVYSLSTIEFGQLRELGFSVTQAKRVIRYREERGGFQSVDELERVPGFPKAFLSDITPHLVP